MTTQVVVRLHVYSIPIDMLGVDDEVGGDVKVLAVPVVS